MPSPEQRAGEQPPEREPAPYQQAARFGSEYSAGHAYTQAQEAIFATPCDLSTFRLQLNEVWHVAVLGQTPPDQLAQNLATILAAGEPASLPAEVLAMLDERRRRMHTRGQWVEGHYRPGKRL